MLLSFNGIALPLDGQTIGFENGGFIVPDHPIIPYIEGDGTGRDIWKASRRVFDAKAAPDGSTKKFKAIARLDSAVEVNYYRNGGILPTVLRSLLQ